MASINDDASVYRLNSSSALVHTVDVITPIVADPYRFGAVAAANALSDIYAMGATPLLALNIVAYPVDTLPLSFLRDILRGARDRAAEAGIPITGGHSINDTSPKYGLAVVGMVDPEHVLYKSGARPGDALVLTKPIGTGIITTAASRGLVDDGAIEEQVYLSMSKLNKDAAQAMLAVGVNACTDVTGFGLLGHMKEMAETSGVSIVVHSEAVPFLPGVATLVEAGAVPAGFHANYRHLHRDIHWKGELTEAMRILLCDAQTSGGLLIAVPQDRLPDLQAALAEGGCLENRVVGTVTERSKPVLTVL